MSDSEPGPAVFFNLDAVDCPRCGERMPRVRLPTSLHQMMWGGWTCPNCGCEMDKWGKARDTEGQG
jgi:hypothetical protein